MRSWIVPTVPQGLAAAQSHTGSEEFPGDVELDVPLVPRDVAATEGLCWGSGTSCPQMGVALPSLGFTLPLAQSAGQSQVPGTEQVPGESRGVRDCGKGWNSSSTAQGGAGDPELSLNGPRDVGGGSQVGLLREIKSPQGFTQEKGLGESTAWIPWDEDSSSCDDDSSPWGGVGTCCLCGRTSASSPATGQCPHTGVPLSRAFDTGPCVTPKPLQLLPRAGGCPPVPTAQPSLCHQAAARSGGSCGRAPSSGRV